MKTIEVVAAVIKKGNKIFATQRGYGDLKGGWEFPGGKIESGETPQKALVREIREELNTKIEVGEFIETVDFDYETFHLTMHCFICEVLEGELELLEHSAAKWLTK
ncbi:MAG TPA: (deoxy)nucleoside triphosphate pyrophosphohydrolase, partial [Candidatus Dorea intestinavium]|nr:(deoxy)nucleoside triphosphate pyrophosphohydrolase [Candidatus Dorea intestinavium]